MLVIIGLKHNIKNLFIVYNFLVPFGSAGSSQSGLCPAHWRFCIPAGPDCGNVPVVIRRNPR